MKAKIRRWFDDRAPRQDNFGLGIRTVYVFFSRQGLLFLFLLIITFATGTNYGNNLILGLFFYLGSIWLVSAIVTFLQLSKLNFTLIDIKLAPAHAITWVDFMLSSHSGTPARQITLSFDYHQDDLDKLSAQDKQVFLDNHSVTLANVKEPTTIRLPIITQNRGVMALPRLNIHSVYPLGITRAWSYGRFATPAIVYPSPKIFEGKSTHTAHLDDSGVGGQTIMGQEDFDKLDTYQEGENLSRVSWGHLARGMGMLTKHFGDTISPSETLDYYAMPAMHHEERLSELAYLLTKKEEHIPFALNLPSGKSPLGAGRAFINDCLIRLAKEP